MSSREQICPNPRRIALDSAIQTRRQRPVFGKNIQQKQPSASSANVFCRLRSNAFSMKQKISRARQSILVKIEDLKKQKDDNQATKNSIGEIRSSISILNAQISLRGSSLSEFKQNSDSFHEMFRTAETMFHKNDERLDAVDRCLQKLESNSRKFFELLEFSSKCSQKLHDEQALDLNLLKLNTESRQKVNSMLEEIESVTALINLDAFELTNAFGLFSQSKSAIQETLIKYSSMQDELIRLYSGEIIPVFRKQPSTVLENTIIAKLATKLDGLHTLKNQLVKIHGNAFEFEQSLKLKLIHLNEVKEKMNSVEKALKAAKCFDCKLIKHQQHLFEKVGQTDKCWKLLLANIDKQRKVTGISDDANTEELELSRRLENICCFKKNRELHLLKITNDIENELSVLSIFVGNESIWLDKRNRILQQSRLLINDVERMQRQLAGDLATTFHHVEHDILERKKEQQKLNEFLSVLSSKLLVTSNQEQLLTSVQTYKEIVNKLSNNKSLLRTEFKCMQLKTEHLDKLSSEVKERTKKFLSLIRDCDRTNSAICEKITAYDDEARKQQMIYQEETMRLKEEFEKSLSELKKKKILEQFEREFCRANESQEKELDRKAKQLKALMICTKEKLQEPKTGALLNPSVSGTDTAASRVNGGLECVQPKLQYDCNYKQAMIKQSTSIPEFTKEARPLNSKQHANRRRKKAVLKTMEHKNKELRKQSLAQDRRNTRDRRNEAQIGCKGQYLNEPDRTNKSQMISRTRHRRQAARETETTFQPTVRLHPQEFDPFEFS